MLAKEQPKDPYLKLILDYLMDESLADDETLCRKLTRQAPLFAVIDNVLYYPDSKFDHRRRAVVPKTLSESIMQGAHGEQFSGHFSGSRLYSVLVRSWYWEGMYTDYEKHSKSCPKCYVMGGGRTGNPPLQPIPVTRSMSWISPGQRKQACSCDPGLLNKVALGFPHSGSESDQDSEDSSGGDRALCGIPEALLSGRVMHVSVWALKNSTQLPTIPSMIPLKLLYYHFRLRRNRVSMGSH